MPPQQAPSSRPAPELPPLFVGRQDALERAASLLTEGRVLWIRGPSGIGKTTFARFLLRERNMRWVACASSSDAVSNGRTNGRTNGKAQACVVMDDVHLLTEADQGALFQTACESDSNTWVFIAESECPDPSCEIVLGPLAEEAQYGLRRGRQPSIHSLSSTADPSVLSGDAARYLAAWVIADGQRGEHVSRSGGDVLTTLRSHLEGDPAAATTWFESVSGAELTAEQWLELETISHPALNSQKLRLALEFGSRRSLAWLAERSPPELPAERLWWAEALIRSGACQRAVDALEAGHYGDVSDKARLLLGEAYLGVGRPKDAADVLGRIKREDAIGAARDIRLAQAHFQLDRGADAKRKLEQAERTLASLPPAPVLNDELTELRMRLGMRNSQNESTEHAGERGAIFRSFRLATLGRFRQAGLLVGALSKRADLPATTRILAGLAQGLLRVTRGQYEGLAPLARNMLQEAQQLGNASLYQWAYMLERVVSLGRAMDSPELPWPDAFPEPAGVPGRYLNALRASHRARRGEPVAEEMMPGAQPDDGPLVRLVCEFAEAHVRLMSGDAERAAMIASHLAQDTVRQRFFFLEGEALLIHCYALLSLARQEELESQLRSLARVSRSLRSDRYRVVGELLALSLSPTPRVDVLLRLAKAQDASPTSARVAAILLGAKPAHDALDALIAHGIRRHWDRHCEAAATLTDAPSWAFDEAEREIYFADRREPIGALTAKILRCLDDGARTQETVSVETLARTAWELDDFHALRDSKRVHVALRRLRKLVEHSPSSPSRILTRDGGYALSALDLPARLQSKGSTQSKV